MAEPTRFSLDVRYSECDMQRVVHNSVYLRWCDDLADSWFRTLGLDFGERDDRWDVMVKAATVTWSAPARLGDTVDIDISATRFGTTSFDVTYVGSIRGEPLFEAVMTYVGVVMGTTETMPVPDDFRAAAA